MATVYFASNRVLTGAPTDFKSYGPDLQSPSVSTQMTYGTASVQDTNTGTNEQGTISSIENTNIGGFSDSAIGDIANAGRNILVFLHGFDNTFEDAITRAAFNRDWLQASGVAAADTTVVAFSWPSLGKLVSFPVLPGDYLHDQNMARLSGVHVMTFLANLEPLLAAARQNGRRAFLLAHSMGNLVLENAAENWFLHGNGDAMLFDRAILAAADCRSDSFTQPDPGRLSGLSRLCQRVTTCYSHVDQVLQLSQVVNLGAQRMGQDGPVHRADPALFPPATYATIDATGFRDYDLSFMTSHQYYRMSPACRQVIAQEMG